MSREVRTAYDRGLCGALPLARDRLQGHGSVPLEGVRAHFRVTLAGAGGEALRLVGGGRRPGDPHRGVGLGGQRPAHQLERAGQRGRGPVVPQRGSQGEVIGVTRPLLAHRHRHPGFQSRARGEGQLAAGVRAARGEALGAAERRRPAVAAHVLHGAVDRLGRGDLGAGGVEANRRKQGGVPTVAHRREQSVQIDDVAHAPRHRAHRVALLVGEEALAGAHAAVVLLIGDRLAARSGVDHRHLKVAHEVGSHRLGGRGRRHSTPDQVVVGALQPRRRPRTRLPGRLGRHRADDRPRAVDGRGADRHHHLPAVRALRGEGAGDRLLRVAPHEPRGDPRRWSGERQRAQSDDDGHPSRGCLRAHRHACRA